MRLHHTYDPEQKDSLKSNKDEGRGEAPLFLEAHGTSFHTIYLAPPSTEGKTSCHSDAVKSNKMATKGTSWTRPSPPHSSRPSI